MDAESPKNSTLVEESLTISSVADFGRLLRKRRKTQKLTIHDAAALAGVSIQFLHDLESGKYSIQMGRALDYASMLGLRLAAVQTPETSSKRISPGHVER